jgi:hypothetical protein
MTDDEIKSKQEETLNNLKKYNKDRKTEIVDDPNDPDNFDGPEPEWLDVDIEIVDDIEGNPTVVTQWAEEPRDIEPTEVVRVKAKIREVQHPIPGLLDDEPQAPMQEWLDESDRLNEERGITVVPTPICQSCGNFAYQGQLHGPGYCREKVQYEQ